jgi:hypothetical protein
MITAMNEQKGTDDQSLSIRIYDRHEGKRAALMLISIGLLILIAGIVLRNPIIILVFFPFEFLAAKYWDQYKYSTLVDLNVIERITGHRVLRSPSYEEYQKDTIDTSVLDGVENERHYRRDQQVIADAIARGDLTYRDRKKKVHRITRDDYARYADYAPVDYAASIGLGPLALPKPVSTSSLLTAHDEHIVIRPYAKNQKHDYMDLPALMTSDQKVVMAKIRIINDHTGVIEYQDDDRVQKIMTDKVRSGNLI